MNYIFIDTETTGNGLDDRLCQIAYKVGDDIECSLFKPSLDIKIEAMSVNHITNRMIAKCQSFIESEMRTSLLELIKDGIVIAHNAKFDVEMLKKENVECPKVICTYKITKHLDTEGKIENYSLQYLRYLLDLEIDDSIPAHDAKSDVIVLEKLFYRLLEKMKVNSTEEDAIKLMIDISSKPSLIRKFPFGKYKGKTIEEVAKNNLDYLRWLYNEKMKEEVKDEDWIYTLEQYLK